MAAGWSLETLADLPLDSWIEFYSAVRSRQMEKLAMMVSVTHASDPQRMRQALMNESKKIAMGKEAEWWKDPNKLKSFAKTLPGVSVKEEKVK